MNAIKRLLMTPPVARALMPWLLRLHNWSYRWAGTLSQFVEPDRLHPKHRIMSYHEWFLREIRPEWTILDIGCGNGALASDVAPRCRQYVGIDISDKYLKEASRRVPQAEFVAGDATVHTFSRSFDAVILSNVLEHIDDRIAFLKKIGRLAPRLLIRVPRIDRDWITVYKKELGIDYRLDFTHFTEYTPEQLEAELAATGLRIERSFSRFGELFAVVVPARGPAENSGDPQARQVP